jgi:hypothetical protein
MKVFILSLFLVLSLGVKAQQKGKQKIIYKYKKYEKFDFEDMVIEGELGAPGDISISSRYQPKFKNPLPYRKNFNAEIKKGIERIR